MELVHQTEKHDWYKGYVKGMGFMSYGVSLVFNIVPKGAKVPIMGYLEPRVIMDKMGYQNLKVFETFSKPHCN